MTIAEMTGHAQLARLSGELRQTMMQIHDTEKDFLLLEDPAAPRQVERFGARVEALLDEIAAAAQAMGEEAGGFTAEQLRGSSAAAEDYLIRFNELIETVDADRRALAALASADASGSAELAAGLDTAIERFDALVADFWRRQGAPVDAQTLAQGRLLQRFARELAVARAGLAAYVAGHDPSYPEVARATFGEVLAQLDLLREQSQDPALKVDLSEARKALIAHDVMLRESAARRSEATRREAELKEHIEAEKGSLRALGRALTEQIGVLSGDAWDDLAADSTALQAKGQGAIWIVGITAAVGVVIGLLVLVLIPRPIVADGSAKSDQMMRSMDAIGVSTRQTAERIKSLSDRMDDINEAVTTISGVADQTTLLSLNASIEANKAGEMGKGFSVVAHEIRRLADRSIDSAGNINAMVRDIQRATESSTLAMDKSSEEIRHGVVLVGESAEALTAINQSMERIQEQMNMILESVRAQAESSRMVQSTSTEMLSSANMVSKAASQTRSVTHDLNNMAAQLSSAVAAFST